MLILMKSFVLSMTFFWLCLYTGPCNAGPMKITSVAVERPVLEYVNNSILKIHNLTSHRISRSDPFHYLQLVVEIYIELKCKDVMVDVHVDEFLSNTYRPTFVRARFNLCEFIRLGNFNSTYARNISGPYDEFVVDTKHDNLILPIGVYESHDITWSIKTVPDNFPFAKGRIYAKFEWKHVLLVAVHADLELKMVPKRQASKSNPIKM